MCGADFSATEGGVLHGKHSIVVDLCEVHVRAHTARTCEATRVYFFRLHGDQTRGGIYIPRCICGRGSRRLRRIPLL